MLSLYTAFNFYFLITPKPDKPPKEDHTVVTAKVNLLPVMGFRTWMTVTEYAIHQSLEAIKTSTHLITAVGSLPLISYHQDQYAFTEHSSHFGYFLEI